MRALTYSFFLLIMTTTVQLSAQEVELQLLNPTTVRNLFSTNDISQFILSSSSSTEQRVRVEISVERSGTGRVSLMRSSIITLSPRAVMNGIGLWTGSPGMKLIRSHPGFERSANLNFQFPAGKYAYCIAVYSEESVLLTQKCTDIELENILALQLIYPLDDQAIQEERPTFSWTPVISPQLGQVDYRIRWVETEKDINSKGQFFDLPAYLALKKQPINYLFYNQKYPSFDRNKSYLWQVQAVSKNIVVAESEIWTYFFEEDPIKEETSLAYVRLSKTKYNPIHRFTGKTLAFEWQNNYVDFDLKFDIIDENGKIILDQDSHKINVAHNGSNFYKIYLGKKIKANKRYELVVYGSKKKYHLPFIRIK